MSSSTALQQLVPCGPPPPSGQLTDLLSPPPPSPPALCTLTGHGITLKAIDHDFALTRILPFFTFGPNLDHSAVVQVTGRALSTFCRGGEGICQFEGSQCVCSMPPAACCLPARL